MKIADKSLPNDTNLLKQLVIEKSQLVSEQIATISDQAKRIQALEEAVAW